MLQAEGSSLFRHHLAFSILSSKPVLLQNIHINNMPRGVTDYEANFLKFIDRITNGSRMEVSPDKTALTFYPGMLLGGTMSHEVPTSRSVTYLIEVALLVLPFAKHSSEITFLGATQSDGDLSLDTIRTVTTRWLQLFGIESSLRIVRRGAAPHGDGCVVLSVKNTRRLRSVEITTLGKVKRVRGISFGCNVAADLVQRCATSSKGVLLGLLPDVYVVTDLFQGKNKAEEHRSGGYGVMLVAETTSKVCLMSQEATAATHEAAEDVGVRAANLLLDQVASGGCVDAHHQVSTLMLMALSPDDVSTVRFGTFTAAAVSTLTMIESYLGVTFAIKEDPSPFGAHLPRSVVVSCIGCNYVSVTKRTG